MEITESCTRCGREEKLSCETDALLAKVEEQRNMKNMINEITSYIQSLDGPLPAVIIITADKTVRVLEHLCSKPVGKFQGCTQRVGSLLSDALGKSIK